MPTYPQGFWKVAIEGTCFSGNEIFSTSFKVVGPGPGDIGVPQQPFLDAIATAWQAFWTNSANKVSSIFLLTQLKMSEVGADGKTFASNTIFHTFGTPVAGGSPSGWNAPQIALVATTTSSIPRGPASKGRMYLPGINSGADNSGHISTTDTTAIANGLKTFFNAVNTAAPSGTHVGHVASNTAARTGTVAAVTGVRVGNVLDTQRRRRDGLVETYVSASLG